MEKKTIPDMKKHIGYGLLALLMTACHESYPGLYAPVYDPDNPNPEVTTDRLPVMISLTDPAYALVTTRGNGPFGFWDDPEAQTAWLEADFGVYAFLTPNHVYEGDVNYAAGEVADGAGVPYCLIDDRKAGITRSCELTWRDAEPPYYSVAYPEYKYNFFLYHIGDAQEYASVRKTQTTVTKFIRIDGTQDVISAYARPDVSDVDELGDNDESKYLMNHAGDLVYSTLSGRLRIDPYFRVRHEMSRLNFSVQKAEGEQLGAGREIRITAVGLVLPVQGEFTVAAHWPGVSASWNDESVAPATGVTWTDETDTLFVPSEQTPKEFGSTYRRENTLLQADEGVSDDKPGPVSVGKSLLVPPVARVGFVIYYRYLSSNPEDVPYPDGTFPAGEFMMRLNNAEVNFQAGQQHEVLLSVYGPQHIELKVDGKGLAWTDGGDIPVEGME